MKSGTYFGFDRGELEETMRNVKLFLSIFALVFVVSCAKENDKKKSGGGKTRAVAPNQDNCVVNPDSQYCAPYPTDGRNCQQFYGPRWGVGHLPMMYFGFFAYQGYWNRFNNGFHCMNGQPSGVPRYGSWGVRYCDLSRGSQGGSCPWGRTCVPYRGWGNTGVCQ